MRIISLSIAIAVELLDGKLLLRVGVISSISATVTVTVWSEVLLALSVALTETMYELFLSLSVGVS